MLSLLFRSAFSCPSVIDIPCLSGKRCSVLIHRLKKKNGIQVPKWKPQAELSLQRVAWLLLTFSTDHFTISFCPVFLSKVNDGIQTFPQGTLNQPRLSSLPQHFKTFSLQIHAPLYDWLKLYLFFLQKPCWSPHKVILCRDNLLQEKPKG